MPNLYTTDTRSMLEGYLYGKVPLEREKPTFGQSKRYFVDPNDGNKRIDVPDGTDPYAFRDAGYKTPSLTDIGSGLTTEINPITGTSLNTSLTNNSTTDLTRGQTGLGSNSLNTSIDLFGNKATADNSWAQEVSSEKSYGVYPAKRNPWTNANAYSGLTQGLNNKTSSISPPQNKTYTLQAHSRALEDTIENKYFRGFSNAVSPHHTGYDLIETDANGNQNMQTLALNTIGKKLPSGGVTEIQSRQGPAKTYTLNDGRKVAWYDQLKESQQQYKSTPNYLEGKNVQTVPLLEGKAAPEAFYKMSVYGDFMNPFKLDYDLEGPNCNTWTTMMHNKYINPKTPQTVSSLFNRNHIGDGGDYKTSNTPQENQNAQFVELLADTYLDHTPMDGYSRPRNIRHLNGTSTTGPIATFSNGKNHFVVNSHGNKGFSNQDYADVFQNALFNNRTGMGLGGNLLTEIGLKGYQKMNQLPDYDVFIDNKKIK